MIGKGTLVWTGQLGNVMKESVQTSLSWIGSQASNFNLSKNVASMQFKKLGTTKIADIEN